MEGAGVDPHSRKHFYKKKHLSVGKNVVSQQQH